MIRLCTCGGGSASIVGLSRNRVAVASCKSCGGKPLLDSRQSLSARMPSTVGLELTNVFNPDFAWKNVTKGQRSASRRARKPASAKVAQSENPVAGRAEGCAKEDPKIVKDMPVSESEKLGVSVLGSRFSHNIEHVPIKKRRYLYQSPSSPPQIPSPHRQKSGLILDSRPAICQESSSPNLIAEGKDKGIATAAADGLAQVVNVDREDTHEINEKLSSDKQEISGISILAAAACDEKNSGDDKFSVREGYFQSLCISSVSVEETTISPETSEGFAKDLTRDAVGRQNTGIAVIQDNCTNPGLNSSKDDGVARKLEFSSRDDRLRWDLNVAMDAWETTSEYPVVNSQKISVHRGVSDDSIQSEKVEEGVEDSIQSKKVEKGAEDSYQREKVEKGAENSKCSIKGSPQPLVDRCEINDLEDSKKCFPGSEKSNTDVHKLDVCKAVDLVKETEVSSDQEQPSPTAFEVDVHASHISSAGGRTIPCEAPTTHLCKKTDGDCALGREGVATVDNPASQKCDVTLSVPVICKRTCSDEENADRNSQLLDEFAPKVTVNIDVTEDEALKAGPLNDEMGFSDGSGITQVVRDCKELSKLNASVGKGRHIVNAYSDIHDVSVSAEDGVKLGIDEVTLMHSDSERSTLKLSGLTPEMVETQRPVGSSSSSEACRIYEDCVNIPGRVALEDDSFDDSDYDSSVSHDSPEHVAETKRVTELQSGYDSQYEDGELRESIERSWEDEGEEVEAEHVDYGSDNNSNRFEAPKNCLISIPVQLEKAAICRKRTLQSVVDGDLDAVDMLIQDDDSFMGKDAAKESTKQVSSRMRFSGREKVLEGRQSSADTLTEVSEGTDRKKNVSVRFDGMNCKDSVTGVVGSMVPKSNLRSWIEGPSRSNNFNNPTPSVEVGKSMGRGASCLDISRIRRGADRSTESSRGNWGHGQNRCNSPSYYDIANFAGASARGRIQRQSTNASSQVGHLLDSSPDRSNSLGRNISARYGPQVVPRGPRGRFNNRSFPVNRIDSSLHLQSYSSDHRRGAPHLSQLRTRSRSRSRTRSPKIWLSPTRRSSRSPNFKHGSRIDRGRSPHRRPGFGPDHIANFGVLPGRRGSPQHTSRLLDYQKDSMENFRGVGYRQQSSAPGRCSPERAFRSHNRYDLLDSSERMREDEYYNRPMHNKRFQEVIGTGRRPRYDGSDDDKSKHGYRYDKSRPIRRFGIGIDEPVKRFQYDIEDDFAVGDPRKNEISGFNGRRINKDYARDIGRRLGDAPRGFREDRGHLRYGDGKYSENSESYGIGKCEDVVAPKRRPA